MGVHPNVQKHFHVFFFQWITLISSTWTLKRIHEKNWNALAVPLMQVRMYEMSCCNIVTFCMIETIFQNKILQMNVALIMISIYKCELSIYFIHGIYGCTQVCLFLWMKFVHHMLKKCITKFIHHTLNGWINEFHGQLMDELFFYQSLFAWWFSSSITPSTNIYKPSHFFDIFSVMTFFFPLKILNKY
jgi:hypothetical protein